MAPCIDRKSYDRIWEGLIFKEAEKYIGKFNPYVYLSSTAKEEIWEKYTILNRQCKNTYMKDSTKLLDRHKVAACYMVAICTAKPIEISSKVITNTSKFFIVNELLAITVGTALVASYARAAIDATLPDAEKETVKKKFASGIIFPAKEKTHHGDYILNYATELYFAGVYNNFNLLSIAHELYLLETLTLAIK